MIREELIECYMQMSCKYRPALSSRHPACPSLTLQLASPGSKSRASRLGLPKNPQSSDKRHKPILSRTLREPGIPPLQMLSATHMTLHVVSSQVHDIGMFMSSHSSDDMRMPNESGGGPRQPAAERHGVQMHHPGLRIYCGLRSLAGRSAGALRVVGKTFSFICMSFSLITISAQPASIGCSITSLFSCDCLFAFRKKESFVQPSRQPSIYKVTVLRTETPKVSFP
jgi:hypothetical protein